MDDRSLLSETSKHDTISRLPGPGPQWAVAPRFIIFKKEERLNGNIMRQGLEKAWYRNLKMLVKT